MSNICIIPARGGSKRIPRKNIKDFLGKPIIAYSIEIAQESGLFDEIMVSTDDEEIALTAQKYGAHVPFLRSAKNSDDHSTLSDVITEVLELYEVKFDYCCCVLPTAPLIQKENLRRAYLKMVDRGFYSVRPVVQFSYPIQRALKISGDETLFWFYPEYSKTRSQDLLPAFHDAGQFYWMHTNIGLSQERRGAIVISETEAQDIDNEEDWKLAEIKYQLIYTH